MDVIAIPSPSAFLRSPVPQSLTAPAISTSSVPIPKQKSTNSKAKPKVPSTSVPGVVKPKQSKSRNGCITCKAKRLKCDESKPTCQQCQKRNVDCGGYKKDFKWRSFVEATFTNKPVTQRPKQSPTTDKLEARQANSPSTSEESPSATGPNFTPKFAPFESVDSFQQSPRFLDSQPRFTTSVANDGFVTDRSQLLPEDSIYDTPTPTLHNPINQDTSQVSVDASYDDTNWVTNSTTASSYTSGRSPRLIDLLLPGTDLNAPPNYLDYRMPQSQAPFHASGMELTKREDLGPDEEVEEIVRAPDPPMEPWIIRARSPASSSSSSEEGFRFDPLDYVYNQPKLHPGSPEMLMLGFDKQTCGILSVKDGPTENPWRTLVWPLARDSPALYHAISSLTAFHSSKIRPEMKMEGMDHMRRSVRSLARGIGNMRLDTALATTLVLAFAESWDVHVTTGIKHLRGARTLINQAMTTQSQDSMSNENLLRLRFLCNTWTYMDVIARLTNVDDDASNDSGAAMWPSFDSPGGSTELDPLMGCAGTLFPLIGRVANLVRIVRTTTTHSINIISQANDLKSLLEAWEPPAYIEPPEDPTTGVRDSVQTAEAYRWATLLYLHQAVPEVPSQRSAELAKKALVYLATVPVSSRAIIVHIYPLLAAGCEATTGEDRIWVEERWAAMSQRMLIGNIDRCMEVVKEVWQRRDIHEAEKVQRQNRRTVSAMNSSFTSPMLSMKRAFSSDMPSDVDIPEWSDPFAGMKRRATVGEDGTPTPSRVNLSSLGSQDIVENIEFDKTVRGRLHWVGVMKDWEWEVLLG